MKNFYVYIMCSKRNGTLYVGVTNNLATRAIQHKHTIKGFTAKYSVVHLVYFETFASINDALRREKQLKRWNRSMNDFFWIPDQVGDDTQQFNNFIFPKNSRESGTIQTAGANHEHASI